MSPELGVVTVLGLVGGARGGRHQDASKDESIACGFGKLVDAR